MRNLCGSVVRRRATAMFVRMRCDIAAVRPALRPRAGRTGSGRIRSGRDNARLQSKGREEIPRETFAFSAKDFLYFIEYKENFS